MDAGDGSVPNVVRIGGGGGGGGVTGTSCRLGGELVVGAELGVLVVLLLGEVVVGVVVVVGKADTYGEVVGDTVGAQVNLRQQLVLHNPATSSLISQRSRRALHLLTGSPSGIINSPAHGHMAVGDDEGELVVGAAVHALEVGAVLGTLDDGAADGKADGVLVVGVALGVLEVG